eukprot:124586-Pleurochrysis_carterae.AAC.2
MRRRRICGVARVGRVVRGERRERGGVGHGGGVGPVACRARGDGRVGVPGRLGWRAVNSLV